MKWFIHIRFRFYISISAGRHGVTGALFFYQQKEDLMKYLLMTLMSIGFLTFAGCGDEDEDTAVVEDTAVEAGAEAGDAGEGGDEESEAGGADTGAGGEAGDQDGGSDDEQE